MDISRTIERLQASNDSRAADTDLRWPRDRKLYLKFPLPYDSHTSTHERYRYETSRMCKRLIARDLKVLDQETQGRVAIDPRTNVKKTWIVYLMKVELNQSGYTRRIYRSRSNQSRAKQIRAQKKWDRRWPVPREIVYLSLSEFQYDTLRHAYNLYHEANQKL